MVASSQKARQEEFEAISVAAAQKLQTAASEKEKKADEKKAELVRQGGIECRRKRILPKHADLAPNWDQALVMNRVRFAQCLLEDLIPQSPNTFMNGDRNLKLLQIPDPDK